MVPPGNFEYNHTEHPCEMTLDDFLDKLQCIDQRLGMEAFRELNDLKQDRSQLLRFFGLGDDVCAWSGGIPVAPGENIYEKLNEFLANHVPSEIENLKKKWEHRRKMMRICNVLPVEPVVKNCIEAVVTDEDKDELKKQYKIEQLPEYGDVEGIINILGWILFWFAYLPCTEAAREAQASYRSSLRDKLTLLLNPLTEEFRNLSGAAQDNPALRAMLEMYCCPLSVRIGDSEDSRIFGKIDKENNQEMSNRI